MNLQHNTLPTIPLSSFLFLILSDDVNNFLLSHSTSPINNKLSLQNSFCIKNLPGIINTYN